MCEPCFKQQKEARGIEAIIIALAAMPLDMKDKWRLRLLSTTWNKAWTHFSEIRHIQYKIPHLGYNRLETLWLRSHAHEFRQHNRLTNALSILNRKTPTFDNARKKTQCRILMCSSQCQNTLTDADHLELITENISGAVCKRRWMIPWFVKAGGISPTVEALMEAKINKNKKLSAYTVTEMDLKGKQNWIKLCKLFAVVNKLIQYKDRETRRRIKSDLFDSNIIVKFPFEDSIIVDIEVENMVDIESSSKPVVVPFIMHDYSVRNILVKNEDVRNDRLAQVTLMWISKLCNMDVTTYNVIPTGESSGWIEIMENCTTLYDIKHTRQTTIMNFIMENNPHKTAHVIKTDFIRSVAISCVLSYVLGLGDRHLENIVVNKNGELLHIDFGWLFGEDPHGVPSEMRITRQTLEAIGGLHSQSFMVFSQMCELIYGKVRKVPQLWYALFKHHCGKDVAHRWVGERLIPGEFDSASATQIVDIVHRNSSTSWVQHILDTTRLVRKQIMTKFKNKEDMKTI